MVSRWISLLSSAHKGQASKTRLAASWLGAWLTSATTTPSQENAFHKVPVKKGTKWGISVVSLQPPTARHRPSPKCVKNPWLHLNPLFGLFNTNADVCSVTSGATQRNNLPSPLPQSLQHCKARTGTRTQQSPSTVAIKETGCTFSPRIKAKMLTFILHMAIKIIMTDCPETTTDNLDTFRSHSYTDLVNSLFNQKFTFPCQAVLNGQWTGFMLHWFSTEGER